MAARAFLNLSNSLLRLLRYALFFLRYCHRFDDALFAAFLRKYSLRLLLLYYAVSVKDFRLHVACFSFIRLEQLVRRLFHLQKLSVYRSEAWSSFNFSLSEVPTEKLVKYDALRLPLWFAE